MNVSCIIVVMSSSKKRTASNAGADLRLKTGFGCCGYLSNKLELDDDLPPSTSVSSYPCSMSDDNNLDMDDKPTSSSPSCCAQHELGFDFGSHRSRRKISSASEDSFNEQNKKKTHNTHLRIDGLVERMVEMKRDRERAAMEEKTSKLKDILQLMAK